MPARLPHRHGLNLTEVSVAILCAVFLTGLLLPAAQKFNCGGAMTQSQNNLKQIGLAMANSASAHNGRLPNAGRHARLWLCGTSFTKDKPGPSRGPEFTGGLLSYMEGNTKALQAPLDPNMVNVPALGCSYSIPAYWGTLSGGTGDLLLPASFPRGTSLCIGSAEMTTLGSTYNSIRPFFDSPYTPAVANLLSTTANSFCHHVGCTILLVDGSVRSVHRRGKRGFS